MSQHSMGYKPTVAYVAANEKLSRAMLRVSSALSSHAAKCGVEITQEEESADIVVLHVIGYPDTVAAIESIKARGKKYAMIQYCVRSTQRPDTGDWWHLWNDDDCVAVWSYYDLNQLLREDFAETVAKGGGSIPQLSADRFYFAPMGVASHFKKLTPSGRVRPYRLFTSGYVAESECVVESAAATAALEARQFHLGPGFTFFGPNVVQEEGVSDDFLVELYNRSEYVAGLRRLEGFEMPALEGLMCGARPVCFDRPHYRHWFGDHAEYIEEGEPAEVVQSLTQLLAKPARLVTDEERAAVYARFNWQSLATGFWRVAVPAGIDAAADRRLRLLWVGDAAISTGFARVTHQVLATLHQSYDVAVLGINFNGDPHPYPYPMYPAINVLSMDADQFGVRRVAEIAQRHNADIVVIQQDPWNFPEYVKELRKAGIYAPVVGFVAVDGRNCNGVALNHLDHAIFWTEFGRREAVAGGYGGTSSVVPLGVDLSTYYGMPKVAARQLLELPASTHGVFIVGNVNRNQPRKRLDLTIQYFAEWIQSRRRSDAYLFLHVAPTGDVGWRIQQLASYYGIANRLILSEPAPGGGFTESLMCALYNCFDVQVSTTAGEGWGLPHLEGMACGIPQIVPDWAALGEWPSDAVVKIPCPTQTHTVNGINVVGGVPDKQEFVEALEQMYVSTAHRHRYAQAASDRASHEMFNWATIGANFAAALKAELPRLLARESEVGAPV